jgi:hypothetical protein
LKPASFIPRFIPRLFAAAPALAAALAFATVPAFTALALAGVAGTAAPSADPPAALAGTADFASAANLAAAAGAANFASAAGVANLPGSARVPRAGAGVPPARIEWHGRLAHAGSSGTGVPPVFSGKGSAKHGRNARATKPDAGAPQAAAAFSPAIHPAHNSAGIVQQPSFLWPAVTGAVAYEIEIAADYDYKKIVVPVTRVETPRFVPLKPLYPATRFWRTRPIFPAHQRGAGVPPVKVEAASSRLDGEAAQTRSRSHGQDARAPVSADGIPGPWSETRVYKLHAPANKTAIPAGATLAEIRAAIAAAPASSLVTFAPRATYRLKLPETDTHFLTLEKRDDLIIDGNDSLFIIETPSAGAVALRDCRRVTLRRFRFDYDPLPHSIGTVVSVNTAATGATGAGTAGAGEGGAAVKHVASLETPKPPSAAVATAAGAVNTTNNKNPAAAATAAGTGAAAPESAHRNPHSAFSPTITLRRLPGYPDFDAPHMLANWSFGMILDPVIPGRVKAGSPLVVNFPGAKVTRHPAATTALAPDTARPDCNLLGYTPGSAAGAATSAANATAADAPTAADAATTAAATTADATTADATAGAAADLFDIGISSANHAKFFAKGDRVIIFARARSNAFCTADAGCADITLDRIVTHAAPGLQFTGIGSTDLKLLACASVPRDATRFFAGNADGVHVRANLLGPWIEGCTFDGIGDDGVALYNKGMAIGASPAPGTLTVAGTFMHLQPGDTFVIFNPFDGQLQGAPRTVTAVARASAPPAGLRGTGAPPVGSSGTGVPPVFPPATATLESRADEASAGKVPATAGSWDVTFTPALETAALAALPMGDATWWKNAQLFNRTRVNAGFVVKNNTFTSIRRYGVIARATDGVITGNTITGSSNSAITLLNEPHFWANGLHSERVLIARNKISASTFDGSAGAGASIAVNLRSLQAGHPADFPPPAGAAPVKPARLHRDIRIEDNTITDWNHRAIFLRGAADCVIKGNTIAATPGAKFLAPDAPNIAIHIDNTQDCVIADNDTAGDPRLTTAAQRLTITDSDNTAADGQVTSGK